LIEAAASSKQMKSIGQPFKRDQLRGEVWSCGMLGLIAMRIDGHLGDDANSLCSRAIELLASANARSS
jgi:hypothetical protein